MKTEKKFLSADLEKCTGCGTCELICAIKRENAYNPRSSRIKILRLYQLLNMAVTCRQCEDAPCVTACTQDCLVQSERNGIILVDEEKCDCCGWCIQACPYGAISVNPENALDLVSKETFDQNIRKATEKKLINYKLELSDPSKIDKESDYEKFEKIANTTKSLNLLIEAFSEPNPIEILIYGMFVKNKLGNLVPNSREKIEKTLELLNNTINSGEKTRDSPHLNAVP